MKLTVVTVKQFTLVNLNGLYKKKKARYLYVPQGYFLFYSTGSNRLGLGFGLGLVLEFGGQFS